MNQTANYTIGIDLGDRQHTVCVLRQSGEIEQELTVRNTREDLLGLARFKGSTAVMETGTHSPWVSRYLQQMGLKVIVANARKVRAISKSDRKNDKSDARMLARLGRADPELLLPIRHRHRKETGDHHAGSVAQWRGLQTHRTTHIPRGSLTHKTLFPMSKSK